MKEAWEKGARILVFPELCLTGYTCGELFLQELLLRKAKEALLAVIEASEGMDGLFFVGVPLEVKGKLYNVAAGFSDGRLLGLVPKTCIPNYMRRVILQKHRRNIHLLTGRVLRCPLEPIFSFPAEICRDF